MNLSPLVGNFVRYSVPKKREAEAFARGRVVATEVYTDCAGEETAYYVRWFDGDGKPDKDTMRLRGDEIEVCE